MLLPYTCPNPDKMGLGTLNNIQSSVFGLFDLYQDPFFEEIMNLTTELLYFAWAMCYSQNGNWEPGGGLEMFSDWDDLTCVWTGFSRRIHI